LLKIQLGDQMDSKVVLLFSAFVKKILFRQIKIFF